MVTKHQLSLIKHSLGGTNPKKWCRNHFMAGPGHPDLPDLKELENHGFMRQVESPSFCDSDAMLFLVTEDGKKELMKAVVIGDFQNGVDENE